MGMSCLLKDSASLQFTRQQLEPLHQTRCSASLCLACNGAGSQARAASATGCCGVGRNLLSVVHNAARRAHGQAEVGALGMPEDAKRFGQVEVAGCKGGGAR